MTQKDIISAWESEGSVKGASKKTGLSEQTVKKTLISAGYYPTEQSEQIKKMIASGMTKKEISEKLGVSEKSLNSYFPYTKVSYSIGEKSENAKRIEKCRKKKAEA